MINQKEILIEHHIHYKEIDGYDETIWLTHGEHIKLHRKLRKEAKCNIQVDELKKISNAAYYRTEKGKMYQKIKNKTYKKDNIKSKYLHSFTPVKNARVWTQLIINIKNNRIKVTTFHIRKGGKT